MILEEALKKTKVGIVFHPVVRSAQNCVCFTTLQYMKDNILFQSMSAYSKFLDKDQPLLWQDELCST